MAIMQFFNKKTQRYQKFKVCKNKKIKFIDNKQIKPRVPFKGVPIVRKRK